MVGNVNRLGLFTVAIVIGAAISHGRAEGPADGPISAPPGGPVCHCAAYVGGHVHLNPSATAPGRQPTMRRTVFGRINEPLSPNEQGLPRGRRYYGGRYFGSFNNRYYGPQYGYF